jgi:hypothetical protein
LERRRTFMIFPLVFLLILPVLLVAFVLFDRLIRAEYAGHRAHWEQDGRPQGFFWLPPESRNFGGWLARQRAAFAWLFRTPDWVRENPESLRRLARLRLLVVVWNLGVLVAAGAQIVFSKW